MSLSKKGELNPMLGQSLIGANNGFFGRTHSAESKAQMSAAHGTAILVYSLDDYTQRGP
jgi:hypothetical protein